jgi:predicted lipid-binding transport protein (Tim44 family)
MPRFIAAALVIGTISLAPLAGANVRDLIGYSELTSRPGALLANGAGLAVAQVEALAPGTSSYAPDTASADFAARTFTLRSGPSGVSPHATEVAAYFYGAGASAAPGAAPSQDNGAQNNNFARSGFGFGTGSNAPPLEINEQDYQAFERLLGDVQTAWSGEDVNKLHTIATPEMVSYFTQDLKEYADRGVVNKVSDVKLLQGDLAESWREGQTDYATLAMRFALVDKTVERATGRVVDGSETPIEATEVWTFARRPGGTWELSAIQQV